MLVFERTALQFIQFGLLVEIVESHARARAVEVYRSAVVGRRRSVERDIVVIQAGRAAALELIAADRRLIVAREHRVLADRAGYLALNDRLVVELAAVRAREDGRNLDRAGLQRSRIAGSGRKEPVGEIRRVSVLVARGLVAHVGDGERRRRRELVAQFCKLRGLIEAAVKRVAAREQRELVRDEAV